MRSDLILGELKEFKRATLSDLSQIKKEIRALNQFKWRVAGGAAVLSVLLVIAIEAVHLLSR